MARGGRAARPMTPARRAAHNTGLLMPKMPASGLKAMLAAEYADALAALTGSSKLSAERADDSKVEFFCALPLPRKRAAAGPSPPAVRPHIFQPLR
jgi:hypothetical protein